MFKLLIEEVTTKVLIGLELSSRAVVTSFDHPLTSGSLRATKRFQIALRLLKDFTLGGGGSLRRVGPPGSIDTTELLWQLLTCIPRLHPETYIHLSLPFEKMAQILTAWIAWSE